MSIEEEITTALDSRFVHSPFASSSPDLKLWQMARIIQQKKGTLDMIEVYKYLVGALLPVAALASSRAGGAGGSVPNSPRGGMKEKEKKGAAVVGGGGELLWTEIIVCEQPVVHGTDTGAQQRGGEGKEREESKGREKGEGDTAMYASRADIDTSSSMVTLTSVSINLNDGSSIDWRYERDRSSGRDFIESLRSCVSVLETKLLTRLSVENSRSALALLQGVLNHGLVGDALSQALRGTTDSSSALHEVPSGATADKATTSCRPLLLAAPTGQLHDPRRESSSSISDLELLPLNPIAALDFLCPQGSAAVIEGSPKARSQTESIATETHIRFSWSLEEFCMRHTGWEPTSSEIGGGTEGTGDRLGEFGTWVSLQQLQPITQAELAVSKTNIDR